MVEEVRHLPYPDRLRLLRIPSLYFRRRRGDMIAVYQVLRGGMALAADEFFTGAIHGATRGHEWKLRKPRARSLVRRRSFSVRVVNDWNSLPAIVVSSTTVTHSSSRDSTPTGPVSCTLSHNEIDVYVRFGACRERGPHRPSGLKIIEFFKVR